MIAVFGFAQTAAAQWSKREIGTLAWLRTVHFVDEKTGWIGGGGGTFLKTGDGGASWKQTEKFTSDTIREISFSDRENGWLLCERDVYRLGKNSPSYLLKTINGGASWEKIEFSGAGRERVTAIFFAENGTGIAVGESGALFRLESGGAEWKRQPAPVRFLLLDGVFAGESRAIIVGAGGSVIVGEDAGRSWKNAAIFEDFRSKLNAVFFINENNGWAVGANGAILQTVSSGRTWRRQNSGTEKDLTDVAFIDTAEGWAIGDGGTILHTTTAGNIWKTESANARHRLEKMHFNGQSLWIVGFGGTVLRRDIKRAG